MRRAFSRWVRRASVVAAALAVWAVAPAAQAGTYTLTVDPSLTFLHTNQDTAGGTVAIDLWALGIHEGDSLLLERLGAFAPHGTGAADDYAAGMIGVFSSTNQLLDGSFLNRVTGAIDAGTDVTTSVSYYGAMASDITQDFAIGNGTTLTAPVGGRYLFVAASDSYWGDNTDPNGDFQLRITAVPEPATAALLMAGLGVVAGAARRRQQRGA